VRTYHESQGKPIYAIRRIVERAETGADSAADAHQRRAEPISSILP
jgi:hypothetical protein